jgi:hypothetical protein
MISMDEGEKNYETCIDIKEWYYKMIELAH